MASSRIVRSRPVVVSSATPAAHEPTAPDDSLSATPRSFAQGRLLQPVLLPPSQFPTFPSVQESPGHKLTPPLGSILRAGVLTPAGQDSRADGWSTMPHPGSILCTSVVSPMAQESPVHFLPATPRHATQGCASQSVPPPPIHFPAARFFQLSPRDACSQVSSTADLVAVTPSQYD